MARMNQEKKRKINSLLEERLTKFDVKWTLSIRNHSEINMNISKGSIDFISNYIEVGKRHSLFFIRPTNLENSSFDFYKCFTGDAARFLKIADSCLNYDNHYTGDATHDYFDLGYYTKINIGQWNKPYKYIDPSIKVEKLKAYNVAIDFSSIELTINAKNEEEAIKLASAEFEADPDKYHKESEMVNIGEYVYLSDE